MLSVVLMTDPMDKSWETAVSELLARAAELCVEQGVDMEAYMRSAASAFLEASPGMREYLEEQQLKATLQVLRDNGRMATA
jgi:hypothetical protein